MCLPLRAFTAYLLDVRGARAQKAYRLPSSIPKSEAIDEPHRTHP